jgi:hypothetical protein
MRYGIGEEASKILGVTPERVRVREKRAIRMKYLQPSDFKPDS